MAYADVILNIVARIIYRDLDASAFAISLRELQERLQIVDERFQPQKYFSGHAFDPIDTMFATLTLYFPVLDSVLEM